MKQSIPSIATLKLFILLVSFFGSVELATGAQNGSAGSEAQCKRLLSAGGEDFSVLTANHIPSEGANPSHCKIEGFILPAINFEVNIPDSWNGKFMMFGNGGYWGRIFDQTYGLSNNYATASTDTGHQGSAPSFALNNQAAEIDFAFRAIHLTTVSAKQIISAYFGRGPKLSYYRGCSNGGRQGLMEAQRFPDDFDGYSIGAPIYDYTYKQTYNAAWSARALFENNKAGYVPASKLKTLGKAVYKKCDALDGLEDGLIDDPRQCDFDPMKDLKQCEGGGDNDQCFSREQLVAIEKIYDGPGKDKYPGHVVGGEWMEKGDEPFYEGWDLYFIGPEGNNEQGPIGADSYGGNSFLPVQFRNGSSFFKYFVFKPDQPEYDFLTDLDFDDVPDFSDIAGLMNASDPDLTPVHERRGKILLWHGWADVGLNPLATISYYDEVGRTMGETTRDDFMRLFMVPGMYHCTGGPGPNLFDDLGALEDWVERGIAPEQMIARKAAPGKSPARDADKPARDFVRSRPLCAYPKVSRYKGKGNIDSANNFSCVNP